MKISLPRRALLSALLMAFTVLPGASFAESGRTDQAKALVQEAGDKFISALADESIATEQKAQTFETLIKRYTDYQWMAGFVAGRAIKDASADEKQSYQDLYPGYLVKTYLPKYGAFKGREQKIINAKEDGKSIVVRTTISNGKKAPIELNYRVRFKDGKPLIFDVLAEGVSLIVTQRSEFASYIQRKGFGAFIERMKNYIAS